MGTSPKMVETNTQTEAWAWITCIPRALRVFLCRLQGGVESQGLGRGPQGGKTVGAIVAGSWHVPCEALGVSSSHVSWNSEAGSLLVFL